MPNTEGADPMPKSDQTEIRVVCAQYGTQGHSQHAWPMRDLKKATQAVIDNTHHVEMLKARNGHPFYERESPHRIQIRRVTAWIDQEE